MNKQNMSDSPDRRFVLKALGLGTASGFLGIFGGIPSLKAAQNEKPFNTGSLPAIKIRSVKAIGTAPQGANLVVVKVETSEPGLYGLGCATFTQRAEVVVSAINNYMGDFCVGKDVDDIEDMWQ